MDGDFEVTVKKLLLSAFPDRGLPKNVHQLDYATSGVMVWAYNRTAARCMSHAFEARTVSKVYLALVDGHISAEPLAEASQKQAADDSNWSALMPDQGLPPVIGEYTWPITDDVEHGWRMMIGTKESPGKTALTRMRLLSTGYLRADGRKVSKVRRCHVGLSLMLTIACLQVLLHPYTGRRHQLRVHTLEAGHPIVGDATYADDTIPPRMMLHAWSLYAPAAPTTGTKREKRMQGGLHGLHTGKTFTATDPFDNRLFVLEHPAETRAGVWTSGLVQLGV
jgi:23S rRNA-/tRNA-specific pseudouridylate synthase